MIIELQDTMTIGDVSNAFRDSFPFLSLSFFKVPHEWGKASLLTEKIDENELVALFRKINQPAAMELHGWHNTGEVEQEFSRIFGLHVQVFRRDGSAWVQTAGTDERTLEEQNEAGRNASQELLDGTDEQFNNENPA